jgi:Na+/proline symporter
MNITIIVLLIYLAITFGIAWFFSRRESVETYFVNKRKTSLWLLTFSNVSTIIGAGSVVGIIAETYRTGVSSGLANIISFIIGLFLFGLLAKKIKSIGDRYNASTIVDFFHNRFDKKNQILTGITQVLLMLIWIGIQAIAMATLASVLIGINYHVALLLAAGVTILYTSIGGLKIDIITDFIQFWIILIMFIVIAIVGYVHVGGISNLLVNLPKGHLNVFNFGGIIWFIGAMLLGGFVYLGNTTHWQRIFSAETQETAKKSFFFAIPFVTILCVLILFIGLVSTVSLTGINSETAIFSLMNSTLPAILIGMGFATILAVIMSSVDSLMIGGSTIIYNTLMKKRKIKSKKALIYARMITILFGMFGFGIAIFVPHIITLGLFALYLSLIFVPPIFAGLYSSKISANAVFYAILISTIILFAVYNIVGKNTFIVTTSTSTLITLFYDRIFSK